MGRNLTLVKYRISRGCSKYHIWTSKQPSVGGSLKRTVEVACKIDLNQGKNRILLHFALRSHTRLTKGNLLSKFFPRMWKVQRNSQGWGMMALHLYLVRRELEGLIIVLQSFLLPATSLVYENHKAIKSSSSYFPPHSSMLLRVVRDIQQFI